MSNDFAIAAGSEFVIGQLLPELFMVVNLSIHLFKHNHCFTQKRTRIQNLKCEDTEFTHQNSVVRHKQVQDQFQSATSQKGWHKQGIIWLGCVRPRTGSNRPQCASPIPKPGPSKIVSLVKLPRVQDFWIISPSPSGPDRTNRRNHPTITCWSST